VANQPGKKAELDKEGIAYDIGKAELDKEGMNLSDEKKPDTFSQADPQEPDQETPTPEKTSRRRLILIASIASGAVFLILAIGITTYLVFKEEPKEAPRIVHVKPTPPPGLDSPSGDLVLDPFMVLYHPAGPKESGVLLAQVSLQVSPDIAYTIGSRMAEIRELIYQRLAANAEVFSKSELTAMLREDLKMYNVKDVGFSQFEKR
jgi:flagellar basal body-associated protein FliL